MGGAGRPLPLNAGSGLERVASNAANRNAGVTGLPCAHLIIRALQGKFNQAASRRVVGQGFRGIRH